MALMDRIQRINQNLEGFARGIEGTTLEIVHATDLVRENTLLLNLYLQGGCTNAFQAARDESLERGYQAWENGAYSLTAVRLFEAAQGIVDHFRR